ncbi:hypothetical protein QNA08_10395 [Chelatococcus sp. SYSU_G07232]|uniref:Uncharacterized protein n=1 Tax=Chelatococcus albus TaxID=3047466 RepID=A0ABT7AGZ5_9HYPH|nr:hypothetical protein [Chelatococcus sp. SYSU_G07232]MDJ1158643.1 hypothetical protein [Chelatococcus sp. SYSU_G07232]
MSDRGHACMARRLANGIIRAARRGEMEAKVPSRREAAGPVSAGL